MAALTEALFAHGARRVGFDVMSPSPTDLARAAGDRRRPAGPRCAHARSAGPLMRNSPAAYRPAGPWCWPWPARPEGPLPAPKGRDRPTGRNPAPALTRYPGAVVNHPAAWPRPPPGSARSAWAATADGITRPCRWSPPSGPTACWSRRCPAELLRVAQGAGGHVLRTTEASGEASGGHAGGDRHAHRWRGVSAGGQRPFSASISPLPGRARDPAADLLAATGSDPALGGADRAARSCWSGPRPRGCSTSAPRRWMARSPGSRSMPRCWNRCWPGNFLTRPDWMKGP